MTKTELHVYATATVDADTRTFSGIAAPYMQVSGDSRKHQFAVGMFGDTSDLPLVAVYAEHSLTASDQPVRIGRVESWDDQEDGLRFSARLNDTEAAQAVYASLKDGSLDSVSVSILATASDVADDVTTYTAAELLELSVVAKPAFAGARILLVNSVDDQPSEVAATSTTDKEPHMEITETAVADLRDEVTDLARNFAQLQADAHAPSGPAPLTIHSFGEYAQKLASGDSDAAALRERIVSSAYTGGTSADSVLDTAWTSDIIKLVDKPRTLLNAFSKTPLPSNGMTLEYGVLNLNTLQVTEQLAEGDDLAFGKVSVDSATTPIKTYGGYTQLSRQEIERGDVNILDLAFRGMAIAYAQRTELVVRTKFLSATGTSVTGVSPTSYGSVLGFVADASLRLQDQGLAPEFVVISTDVFKKLAALQEGANGRYLLDRTDGQLSVTGLTGSIFGLPFVVIPGTNVLSVANSQAIRTFESGGAPFQLSDDNIVNLTKPYSVYGYLASVVQINDAIVKAALV